MRSRTLTLSLAVLVGLAVQATAGVTLSNPKAKVKKPKKGITLSASNGDLAKKKTKKRKAGQVLFKFRKADLKKEVLPLFEEQVGVKISWLGPARKVTLRLTQPVPWQDALELICQFTNTHAVRDDKGSVRLKGKWAGFVDDEKLWDDLGGQVKAPRHIKARALMASTVKPGETRHPITQPRAVIPTIRIGGGTMNFGPPPKVYGGQLSQGRVYGGTTYGNTAGRAQTPYTSPTPPKNPYGGVNYVSPGNQQGPRVGATIPRAAQPYGGIQYGRPGIAPRNAPPRGNPSFGS